MPPSRHGGRLPARQRLWGAYLGRNEEMLVVVELGGPEAHAGYVDVADGDGACDAANGLDDALEDGCTLWDE